MVASGNSIKQYSGRWKLPSHHPSSWAKAVERWTAGPENKRCSHHWKSRSLSKHRTSRRFQASNSSNTSCMCFTDTRQSAIVEPPFLNPQIRIWAFWMILSNIEQQLQMGSFSSNHPYLSTPHPGPPPEIISKIIFRGLIVFSLTNDNTLLRVK